MGIKHWKYDISNLDHSQAVISNTEYAKHKKELLNCLNGIANRNKAYQLFMKLSKYTIRGIDTF